jgi:phosphoribosylformimino-5-aminoimidazole carboxamide ribotide isomerase
LTARQIADFAVQVGFRRLLVLDLAAVGVNRGPIGDLLCRELREAHPDIELITGGGVRDVEDLQRLASWGCDAALVASALHDGRLTADQVRQVEQDRF